MASVLIVEDDFLQAMQLEACLQLRGHMVCGVTNSGEQAVAFANKRLPDIVIMDVRLPGRIDGVAAARRIMAARRCGLIFVTAYPDERIDALAPDAILEKPITANAVFAAVGLIVAQQRVPATRH